MTAHSFLTLDKEVKGIFFVLNLTDENIIKLVESIRKKSKNEMFAAELLHILLIITDINIDVTNYMVNLEESNRAINLCAIDDSILNKNVTKIDDDFCNRCNVSEWIKDDKKIEQKLALAIELKNKLSKTLSVKESNNTRAINKKSFWYLLKNIADLYQFKILEGFVVEDIDKHKYICTSSNLDDFFDRVSPLTKNTYQVVIKNINNMLNPCT